MKSICITLISIIIILHPTKGFAPDLHFCNIPITQTQIIVKKYHIISQKYIDLLAFLESSNNPDKVNQLNYIGLFQFGQSSIDFLKLGFTVQDFKDNPKIFPKDAQVLALRAYTKYHKKALKRYIAKYKNKYHNGIYITEYGILAAAHLGGTGSVKDYFDKGKVAKDANGTSVEKYMELFKNIR